MTGEKVSLFSLAQGLCLRRVGLPGLSLIPVLQEKGRLLATDVLSSLFILNLIIGNWNGTSQKVATGMCIPYCVPYCKREGHAELGKTPVQIGSVMLTGEESPVLTLFTESLGS